MVVDKKLKKPQKFNKNIVSRSTLAVQKARKLYLFKHSIN